MVSGLQSPPSHGAPESTTCRGPGWVHQHPPSTPVNNRKRRVHCPHLGAARGVGAVPRDTHLRARGPGTGTKRGCRGTPQSERLRRRSVETRRGEGCRAPGPGGGPASKGPRQVSRPRPWPRGPADWPGVRPLQASVAPRPRGRQTQGRGHAGLLTRPGSKEGLFWSPGPQEPEPGRSTRPAGRAHVTSPRRAPGPRRPRPRPLGGVWAPPQRRRCHRRWHGRPGVASGSPVQKLPPGAAAATPARPPPSWSRPRGAGLSVPGGVPDL